MPERMKIFQGDITSWRLTLFVNAANNSLLVAEVSMERPTERQGRVCWPSARHSAVVTPAKLKSPEGMTCSRIT